MFAPGQMYGESQHIVCLLPLMCVFWLKMDGDLDITLYQTQKGTHHSIESLVLVHHCFVQYLGFLLWILEFSVLVVSDALPCDDTRSNRSNHKKRRWCIQMICSLCSFLIYQFKYDCSMTKQNAIFCQRKLTKTSKRSIHSLFWWCLLPYECDHISQIWTEKNLKITSHFLQCEQSYAGGI